MNELQLECRIDFMKLDTNNNRRRKSELQDTGHVRKNAKIVYTVMCTLQQKFVKDGNVLKISLLSVLFIILSD